MERLTARLMQGVLLTGVVAALAAACSASPGSGNLVAGGGSGAGGSGAGGSGGGVNLGGSGASPSGGSGGGVNLGGSSSGGSGANTGTGGTCAASSYDGKQVPLDMYIMMDKSGSMDGTKWNGVKSALSAFVNSGAAVAGIGVGIQFFPLGSGSSCSPFPPCAQGCINFGGICVPGGGNNAECNVNTYLPPPVPIEPLPAVAPKIISAMNAQSPGGGTPTLPAMKSAMQATTAYAKQYPDHKVIIVLATDGDPNDCSSTVSNVSAEAAQAYGATPSVMTFVVGIGSVANMDQIATAGGSGKAIVVSSANANKQFLDAMNKIRGKALGCDFLLPKPSGGQPIDPGKVNVVYTPAKGTGGVVYQVSGAAQCAAKAGWYYDNPTQPTKIVLCPTSCDSVKNAGGKIDIQLGCKTQIAPPA